MKIVLALGATLLIAAPTLGFAQTTSGSMNPNSAQSAAPGQVQKRIGGKVNATDAAPGQVQKRTRGKTTAQQAAPGQMKDTTGSTTLGATRR